MSSRAAKAVILGGFILCGSNVCVAQGAADAKSPALIPGSASRIALSPIGPVSGFTLDSVPHKRADTFLGPDKVKHFLMSAFIEAIGFNALQAVGANRGASLAAATTATIATGIGREIHDGRTKGLFSFGDLTWDALGTGAALLVISHSQR